MIDLPDLVTERLWMRPLRVDDAVDLHAAFGDAECMRWWHRQPSETVEDSRAAVQMIVDRDVGHWSFGTHDSADVLGFVGFVTIAEEARRGGFGYAMRRSDWGRGLVAEAARAALAHGFTDVGLASVELWIHRDNRQSMRVAEKLGCVRRGEILRAYPRGLVPVVVYGLTVQVWQGLSEPLPTHAGVEPILHVDDIANAVEWWRRTLGFTVDYMYGTPPTHAAVVAEPGWTSTSGVQLSLRPLADSSIGSVFVTVSDIDVLAARFASVGAAVHTPLGDRAWGMREIELLDPSGNRIRIGTPCR